MSEHMKPEVLELLIRSLSFQAYGGFGQIGNSFVSLLRQLRRRRPVRTYSRKKTDRHMARCYYPVPGGKVWRAEEL